MRIANRPADKARQRRAWNPWLALWMLPAGAFFWLVVAPSGPAPTGATPRSDVSSDMALSVCIDTSLYTNGLNWEVTLAGSLAFVAQLQNGMSAYDISNPGSPQLLDSYSPRGRTLDVAVLGDYAYLANEDWLIPHDRGVTVVDISDPSNLVEVGLNTQPESAFDVEIEDSLLFVADASIPGALWIMSLAVPDSPVVLGSYPTPHAVRAVSVIDTLAYLALAQDGMAILNVADPTSPVLLGALSGLTSAYDIFVVDTIAYVANVTFGLALVDVSEPTAPALLSSFDTPGSANDLEVVWPVAHVADVDGGYLLIDVSDPSDPALKAAVPSVDRMLGLAVAGSRTFGADDTAVTVFWLDSLGFCGDGVLGPCEDCDDGNHVRGDGCGDCLPEPQVRTCLVTAFGTPGDVVGVTLQDSLLFVADGPSGLQIYNARYAGPPAHLGGFNTHGNARRVDVLGNLAAVADQSGGLRLIDVSNPAQPVPLGHFATSTAAMDVQLVDTLAYLSCTDYFHVINVALPSAPDSVASLYGTGAGFGIEVVGNRVYLAGGSTGLFMVDIGSPATPAVIGNYPTGSIAKDVEVRGDTVYVANHTGGVMTLLVFPSGASTLIDILPTNRAEGVVRQGGYLFVANFTTGIQVYDVSTATEPIQVALLAHYNTLGLSIDGGRVYSAAQGSVAAFSLSIQGEHWCGNGVPEPEEYCDDSNFVSGDGCDSCCQLQAPVAVCGNGQVEYPEECDDGNTTAGDGCDPVCLREPAVCGNQILEYPEECDDGNTDPADGCDHQCQPGPLCGDGMVAVPEECDDSNRVAGDGCDSFCQYEHTCGDGVLELGEECDDGNTDPLDGCSADCREEVCPIEVRGDVNGTRTVTSADIITLINYVFKGGPTPVPCEAAGDVNCSGAVTSADVINLVSYVFIGPFYPCDICNNSPLAAGCLN